MYRSSHRLASLGPPGRLLLAALLLAFAILPAAGARAQAPAREPFCYSWDFLNDTTEDADGLQAALLGVRQVTSAYVASDNPFGPPLPASGYDGAVDAYRLVFGGGPALDAAPAHIGACTDRATLRMGTAQDGTAFSWTSAGNPVAPSPLFLGMTWTRLATGDLRVTLYNDQDSPRVIWSLSLLYTSDQLSLDDLNADTLSTQPALADLTPEVLTLPAGSSQSFDVPAAALLDLPPDAALLLSAEFSTEDDPGDLGHLYAQLLAPLRTHLPLIRR